jgi:hypothetical protein
MRMRHIVIRGDLSDATVIFTLSYEWHDFREKTLLNENGCCTFRYTFCLKQFSFEEKLKDIRS